MQLESFWPPELLLGLLGLAVVGCGEPPCPEGPRPGTRLRVTVVGEDSGSTSCHHVLLEPGMIFELVTTEPVDAPECWRRSIGAETLPDFPRAPGVTIDECRPGPGFGNICKIVLSERGCDSEIDFSFALARGINPEGSQGVIEGTYRIRDGLSGAQCNPSLISCYDIWNVLVETVD
jgi:hypothetical protein